jgi:hypothetical protein
VIQDGILNTWEKRFCPIRDISQFWVAAKPSAIRSATSARNLVSLAIFTYLSVTVLLTVSPSFRLRVTRPMLHEVGRHAARFKMRDAEAAEDVQLTSRSVPLNNGFGTDEDERLLPIGPDLSSGDPEQVVE